MKLAHVIVTVALAVLLVPISAQAADVQATLDRSTVQLGETVTLNLSVAGAGAGINMPDLQALQQDFTILGSSQNRSISVVNGRASSTFTIGVALRPNHVGTLVIPSLSVDGSHTAPLQLVVTAPAPDLAGAHPNVFMQAQISPGQGYVGEQFSYVVRLYYAVNINSGSLSAPSVDGMDVVKLGDDLNYDAQRHGRDYHVLERRYALTPQRSGHIEIPAVSFQGETADPMDPNSFFGSSTPISASAPAVSIEVQASPASWGSADWLPARELSLTVDGWPGPQDQARVGQPLNLTMSLQATGLPAEALPALSLPSVSGATVYPGKPTTSTRPDGQWLLGQRQRAFAIVPTQAGTLTIPATTVKWWNVVSNRMEVAEVPAHTISVLPALAGNGALPAASSPVAASTATVSRQRDQAFAVTGLPWRWIAVASVGLWLLTMLAWWGLRRRGKRPTEPNPAVAQVSASARQSRLRFVAAARGGDPATQARSLLAWARAERPAIRSLGDLSEALDDASQRSAIADLQRREFADTTHSGNPLDLARVFKHGFAWKASPKPGHESGLAPLYPFKLH